MVTLEISHNESGDIVHITLAWSMSNWLHCEIGFYVFIVGCIHSKLVFESTSVAKEFILLHPVSQLHRICMPVPFSFATCSVDGVLTFSSVLELVIFTLQFYGDAFLKYVGGRPCCDSNILVNILQLHYNDFHVILVHTESVFYCIVRLFYLFISKQVWIWKGLHLEWARIFLDSVPAECLWQWIKVGNYHKYCNKHWT